MKSIPDRKKARREYLDRKADAYARAIEGGLLIAAVFLFLAHSQQLAYAGYQVWQHLSFAHYRATGNYETVLSLAIALFGTAMGLLGIRGIRLIRQAREAAQISYVPPVTPSTLPAEEILLRGTSEPSAPSETLLRAGMDGEGTTGEELLRSSQGR